MMLTRLEPAALRSRDKHSTTEPLRSCATLDGISSGSLLFTKVLVYQYPESKKILRSISTFVKLPFYDTIYLSDREHSGSVVECLTQDLGAAGSSLVSITVLCP